MDDKYAFLMIDYDTPKIISDIHNDLSDDDLYVEDNKFGRELETHVTLVPCLDNNIDLREIKKYLEDISKYEILLSNISTFDSDKYDVLKCDASSELLHKTNGKIREMYPTHTEFLDFHPHVTIAYVKHGVSDKYVKETISPLVILKPKSFHFSYYDKNGENKSLKWR